MHVCPRSGRSRSKCLKTCSNAHWRRDAQQRPRYPLQQQVGQDAAVVTAGDLDDFEVGDAKPAEEGMVDPEKLALGSTMLDRR